jgi:hypothetical protein
VSVETGRARTADDAQTELQFIGGVFAGIAVLAYLAGFLVRYYFLDALGLSPSSTTLPLYYFGVYGFAVIERAPWTLVPVAVVALLTAVICELGRRRLPHPQTRSHTVYVAYPTLGLSFVAAVLALPHGAQVTARAQFQDLWLPRHTQGVRVVLRPALRARCSRSIDERNRSDDQRLACASEEQRLVLVGEGPRDLIFFERKTMTADALPVTSVFRLRREDVLMTTTRTGP